MTALIESRLIKRKERQEQEKKELRLCKRSLVESAWWLGVGTEGEGSEGSECEEEI